jgi:hypothetical protein
MPVEAQKFNAMYQGKSIDIEFMVIAAPNNNVVIIALMGLSAHVNRPQNQEPIGRFFESIRPN